VDDIAQEGTIPSIELAPHHSWPGNNSVSHDEGNMEARDEREGLSSGSNAEKDNDEQEIAQVSDEAIGWQTPDLKDCLEGEAKVLVIYLCTDAHAFGDSFFVVPALNAIICKLCSTRRLIVASGAPRHFNREPRINNAGQSLHPLNRHLNGSTIRRILKGFHVYKTTTDVPSPPWWCSSLSGLDVEDALQCPCCHRAVFEEDRGGKPWKRSHTKCAFRGTKADKWTQIKAHRWIFKNSRTCLPIISGRIMPVAVAAEQETSSSDPWQQTSSMIDSIAKASEVADQRYKTFTRLYTNMTPFGILVQRLSHTHRQKLASATCLKYETNTAYLGGILSAWVEKTFSLLQESGGLGICAVLVAGSRYASHALMCHATEQNTELSGPSSI
jgi:hypothetical protein